MKFNKKRFGNNGYVALISILIVGAIGLSVATSLVLLGLGSSRNSLSIEQSSLAKSFANACADEALRLIWDNDAYVGSGSLNFEKGNCTYLISNATSPKNIIITGSAGFAIRRIDFAIDQFKPYLNISNWQEVAE